MKSERYLYLRQQLKRRGLTPDNLAAAIGKSRLYVEVRLTGAYPWAADDRALIMQLLGEPEINYYRLFPPGGMDKHFNARAAGRDGKAAASGG